MQGFFSRSGLLPMVFLPALLGFYTSVGANEALAKAKACLACHTVEKKVVGPAFRDISAKYAGVDGADALLANKIMQGGGGVWGPVPMPRNVSVKPDEALLLSRWVLSLPPK